MLTAHSQHKSGAVKGGSWSMLIIGSWWEKLSHDIFLLYNNISVKKKCAKKALENGLRP